METIFPKISKVPNNWLWLWLWLQGRSQDFSKGVTLCESEGTSQLTRLSLWARYRHGIFTTCLWVVWLKKACKGGGGVTGSSGPPLGYALGLYLWWWWWLWLWLSLSWLVVLLWLSFGLPLHGCSWSSQFLDLWQVNFRIHAFRFSQYSRTRKLC